MANLDEILKRARAYQPSVEELQQMDDNRYDDYRYTQKSEAAIILNMPEDRRVKSLCKKKEWRDYLCGEYPPEYNVIRSLEINWFEPDFRVKLLESLSPENRVKVLNKEVNGKTVYRTLPAEQQESIIKTLSPEQQKDVLNPPSTLKLIARFFGVSGR